MVQEGAQSGGGGEGEPYTENQKLKHMVSSDMSMCQFGPFISKRADWLQTHRGTTTGVCGAGVSLFFNAKGCVCLCVMEIKRTQQHAQWGKTTLAETA